MRDDAEQDECLDRLEETIVSTKHIALAINEELDLHVRLIVSIVFLPAINLEIPEPLCPLKYTSAYF